jgi:hypothetical protein
MFHRIIQPFCPSTTNTVECTTFTFTPSAKSAVQMVRSVQFASREITIDVPCYNAIYIRGWFIWGV